MYTTIKRYKNLILLFTVTIILILLVIWIANKSIRKIDNNFQDAGSLHTKGPHLRVSFSFPVFQIQAIS